MKKRCIKISAILLILCVIVFICLLPKILKRNDLMKKVKLEVIKELGADISLQDFLFEELENVSISDNLSSFTKVGEYNVKIILENESFESNLKIVDTTPPKIEVRDITLYIDEEMPKSQDFIVKIEELSDFIIEEISFEKVIGEQNIEIVVVDKYNNRGVATAKLIIKEDKEAPVFDGLFDISIELGENVDLFSGVSAFDKRFGSVDFTIDDSHVNYKKLGNYIIYYEAKDALGNSVKSSRKIEIKNKEYTYMIENFPTFKQYPNYPNGCESVALYNLLRFYDVNVTIDQIVDSLKKGIGPYRNGSVLYGGNPEVEFVGDPRNIHGYGVFQKPIIEVANKYKSGIIDYSGHALNDVLNLVKEQIPVQVWASINMRDTKVCTSWIYPPTGEKIDWICDLHSIVLIGYNEKSVFVSDSYTGNIEEYSRVQFEKMYNLFGKRAIYYK